MTVSMGVSDTSFNLNSFNSLLRPCRGYEASNPNIKKKLHDAADKVK